MYLYRFEVELEVKMLHVVVAANDQETAFVAAEEEVEKNFLKLPTISSITLLEKKPIRKTAGFVIE
nr:DUF3906 family protein [Halalkalibacter alkalisediminis]